MNYLKTTFILSTFFIFQTSTAIASGGGPSYRSKPRPSYKRNYQRNNRGQQSLPRRSSLAPSRIPPQPLSRKSIRQRLDSIRKNKQISINYVNTEGSKFIVKGSYRDKSNFAEFMRRLRSGRKEKDSLKLSTKESNFAGQTNYQFTIKGLNRWK